MKLTNAPIQRHHARDREGHSPAQSLAAQLCPVSEQAPISILSHLSIVGLVWVGRKSICPLLRSQVGTLA